MQISFFEEFPTKENLAKLKFVTWNTKLYLATKSLKEFEKIKKQIKASKHKNKIKEYIYWPILEKKEGYWISPFTKRKALKRIFKEIDEQKGTKIPVMIDAELPTTKNPSFTLHNSLISFQTENLFENLSKAIQKFTLLNIIRKGN